MRQVADRSSRSSSQGILHVVDCIYAAACGETPWDRVVAAACRVGRLDGCALALVDTLGRRRIVLASCAPGSGTGPDKVTSPLAGDARLTQGVLRSAPGAVWRSGQGGPDTRSATAPSPSSSKQPGDFASWACVVVGKDERQVICVEAHAGAGRSSDSPDLEDFLRQLAPHLTRAWRLRRARRAALATCAASPAHSPSNASSAHELAALPGLARLRAEFGLTRAEARLALHLAEGASLASAAQAFNVKRTTIRSQLQQVFAKTGTSRQTELLALLVSRGHGLRGPLPSPVRREPHPTAL